MNIKQNIPLAPYTTFKLGGQARFFCLVKSIDDLKRSLAYAKEHNQAIFILAGGSNLIVADHGFDGLVIKIEIDGFKFKGTKLISGPSTLMETLVDESIKRGLGGLEWAGGLPGTFGGAIRGNAGAFQGEIKDSIITVKSIDFQGKVIERQKDECNFEYRDSIFKQNPNEIITEAVLQLKPGDKDDLFATASDHRKYRQDRHPLEYPNAGSIFKNTPVGKVPNDILPQFKDVIKTDPFPIVPTAKIIADAGLSGQRMGDVQISTKHTNYMVNLGGGKASDLVDLIKKVKRVVKEKFDIELEVEPQLVGFPENILDLE
jgi:UDP-N-acetylmuramate dehydrogenase